MGDLPDPRPVEPRLYVLRVWFERDGPTSVWRASLLYGRETRLYFSSPSRLLEFLARTVSTEATPPSLPDA